MKMVKLKLSVWQRMVKKLKECFRANRALNKQIREYEALRKSYEADKQ